MIELPELVLASGSPRRAEILTSVGWPFVRRIADIDERVLSAEGADEYVCRLARKKASAVEMDAGEIVLGADTIVVVDDQIIGKPVDLNDARRMIRMLSGKWHEVYTGLAIVTAKGIVSNIQRTQVKFAAMSDGEISFLAERGDPLDKAGAYAVQAQAALFIDEIRGDYWNVVGLPVRLVYKSVQDALRVK